jgi:MFS family permease
MVADIVPFVTRGKYFSSRNMAMGVAALLVAPLAGQLIKIGNGWGAQMGYQLVFGLAFIAGIISTLFFSRVKDSPPTATTSQPHQKGDLRRTLHQQPTFLIFVISAFVFNMSLQVAAPFFNVYLVQEFNASTTIIGMIASISSLTALFGQRLFGRLLDQRGAIWIQLITGFTIPLLPLAWMLITAPWQVGIINTLGGFIWAGYTLSNFNLLLELTPETQRPRAVALYQTAVFSSAVVGPLLGGYLADNISFLMIFAFSGVGRFAGMGLFWWGVARQKTKQPV